MASGEDFFAMVLSVYTSLMNDGTTNHKCGTPGSYCEGICLDLELNVIDCPEDQVSQLSNEYVGEAMGVDHTDL